jgi:uncharacterized protein YyaL (SSP411 family)
MNPAFTNRLSRESSPYLLQHAHNPVDWHAWGPEAFEVARREGRPIFLSVGYSSCYWCHVMERESFENAQIAAAMNAGFVNIKVDREQRPDVDQLYMLAVQILTRQGGWPMSVFLTPDLRPFYGGTYFPPNDSYGRPGFGRILAAIDGAWKNRRDEVSDSAENLMGMLRRMAEPRRAPGEIRIDLPWIEGMIARSVLDFDPTHGGFGGAPKFPRETLLELMLASLARRDDDGLRKKLSVTLDAMAAGGIRDQLGGAFHRYSTDERWLVPHFEIMLYDNAMLLWIYAEAHRQTPNPEWAAVAAGIADFILSEMTSPEGLFYTALDAEVDAKEGGNYLWTGEEVREALGSAGFGAEPIERFLKVYGLDGGPNFSDPHAHGDAPQKNVLFQAQPGLLDKEMGKMRAALYKLRRGRKQPMLDTKVLTSWNALTIRGLAHAGRVLNDDRYTQAATRAAGELLRRHRAADGGLLREGKIPGFLDDYAFLVQALLGLGDHRADAENLAKQMKGRFYDEVGGGFYFSDKGADDLIVRQKVGSDSPLPSGNAVAAMVMLELDEPQIAAGTLEAFAGQMEDYGEGASAMVEAAMKYVMGHGALVVGAEEARVGRPPSPQELAVAVLAIEPVWTDSKTLELRCKLQEGYHVDAPLRVACDLAGAAQYPPGDVYRGAFQIVIDFETAITETVGISLNYQACDESACLPRISRSLQVFARGGDLG